MMKLQKVSQAKEPVCRQGDKGQMSVELMVVLPVIVALALIVTNGLSYMATCASFDRIARNAIRLEAAAPGYGQNQASVLSAIEGAIQESAKAENVSYSVSASSGFGGQVTYEATIDFSPTLFGLGLRDEIFGVSLPRFHHGVSLTVDPYHPGIFF